MFKKPFFGITSGLFRGAGMMCGGGGHGFFAHGKHGTSHGGIIEHLSTELDLTEEQKQKVASITEEIKQRHGACDEIHADAFKKIKEEIKSDELNKETFKSLFSMEKSCKDEMHDFFVEKLAEFHSILKPEQRNKLADRMTDHHGCCH